MATIQIRDLPDAVYDVLRQRARDRGQSLQAYMRETVIDLAFTPTKAEVIVEIERSLAADGGVKVAREVLRAAREDGRR
jgi:plasmid stability protein